LNNRRFKIKIPEKYPKEVEGTSFEIKGKKIEINYNVTKESETTEYPTLMSKLSEYIGNHILKEYKKNKTDGFDTTNVTIEKIPDSDEYSVNYGGTFLVKEAIKGTYIPPEGGITIEHIFKSVFDTYLNNSLFDRCISIAPYTTNGDNQISFSY
jgi:hypothetical protein